MTVTDALAPAAALGPLLVRATGDDRWSSLSSELITGGKSNLTFVLRSSAGELILRRPPTGTLLPTAHDMSREARVQRALAPTAVPVATIVLEDTGEAIGVPFYVMSKVEGHIIRDTLPPGYADTPPQRRQLGDTLIDTLAVLHAVDPAAVGLGDFGRPEGFLARQVRRWRRQWEASRSEPVPAVEALADILEQHVPSSPPPTVVHGDFRLDNCVMDPADPGVVAAVLDWEMSTVGDPLTDLGLLLFYWREPGESGRGLTPGVTGLPGFPNRRELVERYSAGTSVPLESLWFYEAFAHFKFAAIAQGIAARVDAGAMGGQDFGDLRREIRGIAEAGLAVTADKTI